MLNLPATSLIPLTASLNCQNTSGFSGFPKFKQSTNAIGLAPILIALFIDSSTADAAPSYGFNSTCVLLQSVPIVNDVSSSTFITAASSPGFTIVLSCTS